MSGHSLGFAGLLLGISGEKGMTRTTPTDRSRSAAITSQTAFVTD